MAGAFGAFAGLFALDERRLLAASTDSVGSKLVLARRARPAPRCGADLAAHCINDVLTTGAEPLFFLDYVAANTIDLEQVAELVEGAADVCRAAGCAILGGETAELPGRLPRGRARLRRHRASAIVDRDRPGRRLARRGRRRRRRARLGRPARERLLARPARSSATDEFDADLLLAPTRLYLDDVRALRARADVRALAHVTGGGIVGNLARVLPEGVGARRSTGRVGAPARLRVARRAAACAEDELRRVFNLGIGYCAVVPAADVGRATS